MYISDNSDEDDRSLAGFVCTVYIMEDHCIIQWNKTAIAKNYSTFVGVIQDFLVDIFSSNTGFSCRLSMGYAGFSSGPI